MALDRTHPDDRMRLRQILDRASIERSEFIAEHRLLMADGSVKYVRAVAHPSTGEDPESFVFVGAVMDITERKRAEEERERLSQLEADSRVHEPRQHDGGTGGLAGSRNQAADCVLRPSTARPAADWLQNAERPT